MRILQKEITADLVKLGEKIKLDQPTPTYDKLKNGDFIGLPRADFLEKLEEAAKELGEEESLTERIVDPAQKWIERFQEVAVENVEDIDDFLKGKLSEEESELIPATEDVKTKLNIGDKFKLKGKVTNIDSQESSKKKGSYNSITVEFPFNFDFGNQKNRFTTYFSLKDGETQPFKIDDEITVEVELKQIKGKKPEKEGDLPVVYYGLYFESPDGFKKQDTEYANFAYEKAILKNMIGEIPATESAEQNQLDKPELEPGQENIDPDNSPEKGDDPAVEGKAADPPKEEGDPAIESAIEDDIDFDYDNEEIEDDEEYIIG